MATIDNLHSSITSMPREDALNIIRHIRESRKIQKKPPKNSPLAKETKKVRKEIGKMTPEQAAEMLKLLQQIEEATK